MTQKPGDKVEIETTDGSFTGIVMPNETAHVLFLKLSSGYNVGIEKKKIKNTKILEAFKETKKESKTEVKENKKLPTISILHTGGTIASQVDYRTGAVVSRFTPQDLLSMFPEIHEIANIRSKLVFQMFSEDMEPEHWVILAKEAANEIQNGAEGVIITHGTDTLAYTSSALSFALQNLGVPVLLVGAQRSSDRPSSDAASNIIAAAKFIANSDFSGVGVCMHKNEDDTSCLIHSGVSVKKMHSSRRDAFRSINQKPFAEIDYKTGKINWIRSDYAKKDKNRKLILKNNFEKNIAIIKVRPGITPEEIEMYKDYKGIVFEGTGLGHIPNKLIETIKKITKKTIVLMNTQCIYGAVNMNVYSTGRDLLNAGVLSCNGMTLEAAYAKLSYVLGHEKDMNVAKKEMLTNLAGELPDRIEKDTFLI